MSTKLSRRSFLKCTGMAVAATGAASLLGGCSRSEGNTDVGTVQVGDTVQGWNGLGVQLASVFTMSQNPAEEGYEYIGVRIIVQNQGKSDLTIGAEDVAAIDAAYPVPPMENVDANFEAVAQATPDFTASCDEAEVLCSATMSIYNSNSQSFADSSVLPVEGSGYVFLMLKLPENWKKVEITYYPTFAEGESLTFAMEAADVLRS